MRRRVVVTGMGAVTPLGNDIASTWDGLMKMRSGVDTISHFDASGFPTKFASEVKGFSLATEIGDKAARYDKCGRNIEFALGAAAQALRDSGILDTSLNRAEIGVYLGAGEGQQDFPTLMGMVAESAKGGGFDYAKFARMSLESLDAEREVQQEPNMPSGHVANCFDLQGPNLNCLTACAASSQAIGEATDLIRRGDVTAMLSGGAHSMIHPFGVTGFNLLTALSTRNDAPQAASRPFDKERDGFVLGEGAGMLILEEYEHAKARGATIYGEILGYGSSADAYRITDIPPDGRGAVRAIKMALADAGVTPDDIQYINAHGTSTAVNDRVETHSIKETFGDKAYKTPVSSIKSMLGHLIAAAGSVEAIACLLASRDSVLPPTINYTTPDPDCDLDYVPNEPREATIKRSMSNSFGFGGQNVTLILGGPGTV